MDKKYDEWLSLADSGIEKALTDGLDDVSNDKICAAVEEIEEIIDKCEKLRARLGRVLDYDRLNGNGFSESELRRFEKEDREYAAKVDEYYARNLMRRKYMFGYPANMENYSYTTSYLRHLESKMYLMNNCGDPYQKGNYGMDSKSTEKKIIALVAENFGVSDGE